MPTQVYLPPDPSDDAPPNLEVEITTALPFPAVRAVPPRPRTAPPLGTDAEDTRPAAPQLQPRLSAQEQAAAEQQTIDSIRIAEHNLLSTLGRQLNSTQSDLVGKTRTFIGQAREAIRDGDWLRARNLAKKAEVLSAALLTSP